MFEGIAFAEEIQIVTEDWPPFQIVEKGKVVGGFSVDIMRALLKETGVHAEIKSYPWARAYKMALTEKNILIFSITRNKERESLFKWVGSLSALGDYLWSLEVRKDIVINSLEDAKLYKIGVVRNDLQHQFLNQKGFDDLKHLQLVTKQDQAIKMLHANRVDLIMGPELPLLYRLKILNLDSPKLKTVYYIGQQWGDLSIAFSKNTSDIWVKRFQEALERIKENGTFAVIQRKWQGACY